MTKFFLDTCDFESNDHIKFTEIFVKIRPSMCDMDQSLVLLFALGGFPNSSNLKSWINCQ